MCTSCQAVFEQPLGKLVTKTSETSGHINSIFRTQAGPLIPDKCTECDSILHVSGYFSDLIVSNNAPQIAGPMWSGQLHDSDFIGKVLGHLESSKDQYGTAARMKGMLTVAQEVRIVPLSFFNPLIISRNFKRLSILLPAECPVISIAELRLWMLWRQSFSFTHILIAYTTLKGLHFLTVAIKYLVPMPARVP